MTSNSPRTPRAPNHIAYDLLARAHSPTVAEEIFQENVIRRPLLIRRTTAADRPTNEREARRRAREAKIEEKARRKRKPRPLGAKQKRALGIHEIPPEQQKYEIFVPLHRLWLGYVRELLGVERVKELGFALDHINAGSALASADWHGAEIEVVKSRCVGRVGICGIVAKETRGTFEIITEKNELKVVPKEHTVFRTEIPISEDDTPTSNSGNVSNVVFEIVGDQFIHRPAERATKKFKFHLPKDT